MIKEIQAAPRERVGSEYEMVRAKERTGFDSARAAAELVSFLASPAANGLSGRNISAVWDPWRGWAASKAVPDEELYVLRRIDRRNFRFEIFGEKGFLHVEGLAGSYGMEKLVRRMRRADPENQGQYTGGAPEEEVEEFPGPDVSWDEKWREFTRAILEGGQPLGSGRDGLRANRIIDAVYRSAPLNAPVPLR